MGQWGAKSRGFTVVELVIVVVVISILAGIVTVAYRGVTGHASEVAAKAELEAATAKLARFKAKNGVYAPTMSDAGIVGNEGSALSYESDGVLFCLSVSKNQKHFFIREDGSGGEGACPITLIDISEGTAGLHECGIALNKKAYCLGYNAYGQLGDGTLTSRRLISTPILNGHMPVNTEVRSIGMGGSHSCLLSVMGLVYCWGSNAQNQLGDGTATRRTSPVAVQQGAIPTGVGVNRVATGYAHNCALAQNQNVYCWGWGADGQLGNGASTNASTPVAISRGAIPPGEIISTVRVSHYHSCVVTTTESAYCWGANTYGVGDGTMSNRSTPVGVVKGAIPAEVGVKDVAPSKWHTCLLATNGRAYCWGTNTNGGLGDGTNTNRTSPAAVQQGAVPAGVTFVDIAGGDNHTCAVGSDGWVYCWGYNSSGQLGDNTTTHRNVPVALQRGVIPVDVTLKKVYAGYMHTCALASNGKMYCWGSNSSGQLGDNTTTQRNIPVEVQVSAP